MYSLTLRFRSKEQEQAFMDATLARTRLQGQVALLIGMFVYILHGMLDQWFVSPDLQQAEAGDATAVQYDWLVSTSKAWMNLLAPLASPLFRWNHDWLMQRGGEALAHKLGTRLLASRHEHI